MANLFSSLKEQFIQPFITAATAKPEVKPPIAQPAKVEPLEVKLVKSVLQGMAQSVGTVALTLAYPATKKLELTDEDLSPTIKKLKDQIFGTEPIKTAQLRIAESQLSLEQKGLEIPFTPWAIPTGKASLPLAIFGTSLAVGLDFTGFGGGNIGKQVVVKNIIKETTKEGAVKLLTKVGVADDLAKVYASKVVKTTTEKEAINLLNNLEKVTKETKLAKPVAKEVPKVVTKERQFLQSVREARPDIPLKVGGQYIPRSTDDLADTARTLIKSDITKAEQVAKQTDDAGVATASELIKHYGDEAAKTTNQAIKNTLWDKASDIAHEIATNLTEGGREIQAASIMGRLTPEGLLRTAAKEINKANETRKVGNKIPKITAEQTKKILDEANKIKKLPDGIEKARASGILSDYIASLVPTVFWKKFIAVWKAGLLTGVKTSGLNTMSNLLHGTTEVIKDIPAKAVDSVVSLFTKKQTIGLTLRGIFGGTKTGFKKGWDYLKTGFDERNMAIKLDYHKVNFGNSKIGKGLQKYEETIFHLMGAEDQPFYYGAKARSLQSQAIAQAKNAKLKGNEAKKFIDNLVSNPTDNMLKYAVSDAEISVFQNKTALGEAAKGIQRIGKGAGELVVPFGRTPAAVATQLINYSPVGAVKTIIQNWGKKFDQRLFSQGMGRAITGTGIMYIGTELFKKGLINLSYPKGEREQKLWETEGRTANSFYDPIMKRYRNLNVFGPAGMAIVAGGYYQQALQETGSPTQAMVAASIGGVKAVKEQTFLQGISSLLDAIDNPEGYSKSFVNNFISSFIPTIIGDVAKAIDTAQRRTPGWFDPLLGKVPGARQTLEPRINVLGQEVQQGGNFVETLIDPTRPSRMLSNSVNAEFRRLFDAGVKVSPTLLGDKNGYKGLTPEENTSLWEKTGELTNTKLKNLIELPAYKKLSDEDKGKLVSGFINKAKLISRAQAVMELTEGLSGNELKTKLGQLKESGLMTKEVLKEFLKLR